MSEQREANFSGSPEDLVLDLGGRPAATAFAGDARALSEAAIPVLEFLNAHGARIRPTTEESSGLEVRIGGSVFLSVRGFVWTSAAAILKLAFSIATHSPETLTSVADLIGALFANISVFPPDTTEFKAYTAVAALQHDSDGVGFVDIQAWMNEFGQEVHDAELRRGLSALAERSLIRSPAADHYRIAW